MNRTGLSATTVLLLLGALVLSASCLNYANLATAQAYARAREVALHRIIGASRTQVIVQHLIESFLLALVAVAVVLSILLLAASFVSGASVGEVLVTGLMSSRLWTPVLIVLLGVSLMGGGYPAFVLSRTRSANALRCGRLGGGASKVPTVFVGVQFAVASLMLIMLFVVHAQNEVMRESAIGASGDPVVVLRNDLRDAGISIDLLRSALLLDPNVRSVTANQIPPWQFSINTAFVRHGAGRESASLRVYDHRIGYDFFETVGIRLLAGRTFDRTHANDAVDEGDATRPANVIVDQVLASQLGWSDPAQAVGQAIYAPTSMNDATPPRRLEIVGVVEAKPLVHFGFGMTSGIYYMDPTRAAYPIVRLSGANVADGLAAIDATWAKLVPDVALQRQFMDESFEQSYQTFQIVSSVFAALAALALGVCVMGLIAMAIHMTGRRVGEIGVRKTLGASAGRILAMLLRDFARPVVIANLLMWPIGFGAAKLYFDLFIQRASLSAWPLIGSLVLALTVAWLAVIVQAGRAARMKPAMVLRYG